MCPENLQNDAPRWHPDQVQEPPQLAPSDLKERRLYSKLLLDVWAQPSDGGNSFWPFVSSFFRSLPTACYLRWEVEHRWTGKSKALPFGSVPSSPHGPVQRLQYCWRSAKPPVHHSWMLPQDTYLGKWYMLLQGLKFKEKHRKHATYGRKRTRNSLKSMLLLCLAPKTLQTN